LVERNLGSSSAACRLTSWGNAGEQWVLVGNRGDLARGQGGRIFHSRFEEGGKFSRNDARMLRGVPLVVVRFSTSGDWVVKPPEACQLSFPSPRVRAREVRRWREEWVNSSRWQHWQGGPPPTSKKFGKKNYLSSSSAWSCGHFVVAHQSVAHV
jgi:hypothetical protein